MKILEEIFKETDEKCGEILAKFSVDFRPSISREIGHKKFHTDSSTHQDLKFHTAEPKFFHSDTLEVGGPKILRVPNDDDAMPQGEAASPFRRRGPRHGAATHVHFYITCNSCLASLPLESRLSGGAAEPSQPYLPKKPYDTKNTAGSKAHYGDSNSLPQ